MTREYKIKAQIRRLKESVERLESWTTLQIDSKAVSDELLFIRQVESALRKLVSE